MISENRIRQIIKECVLNVLLEMSPTRSNKEEFLQKAHAKHGDLYDYSQVGEYVNNKQKVPIKCRIHGTFLQRIQHHLDGQGCPFCKESHLEQQTNLILKNFGIVPERDYRIPNGNGLQLDFFITQKNIGIECQGIQHFQPVPFFGGEERFEIQQRRDQVKAQLCKDQGIKLYYINYYDTDIQSIIQKILSEN